jgi:hypothetical protein
MIEDLGGNTQQEDLIGDDVASDLASAMNDGQTSDKPHDEGHADAPGQATDDSHTALPPARPPVTGSTTNADVNTEELHDIKQQALQQLGPLIQHIDQEPEERFDTLMMMIRASDDASLIQPAYEAAQQITDDNKKAQALLDVVNEVNYLTRQQDGDDGDQHQDDQT